MLFVLHQLLNTPLMIGGKANFKLSSQNANLTTLAK
jgi:hypothetical protein